MLTLPLTGRGIILADMDELSEKYTFFGQLKAEFSLDIPADAGRAVLSLEDVELCVEACFQAGENR